MKSKLDGDVIVRSQVGGKWGKGIHAEKGGVF